MGQSACVLCSMDCGMDVAVKDGRIVGVRGRAEDRVNHGRLGHETKGALDAVGEKLRDIADDGGRRREATRRGRWEED